MINNKKVLAIIPARGGSKGLPKKNIKPLSGRPLVGWPIKAAQNCNEIDKIIVSTDSQEIANIAIKAGIDVASLRPQNLASDNAKSSDVILYELEQCRDSFDYIVMLEPTSPLTNSLDITKALSLLDSSRLNADSIVGISAIEATHPEYSVRKNKKIIEPAFAKNFSNLKRRQEIESLFFLEGTLYISDVNSFKAKKSFYHDRTMGYEVPRWKSFEVDDLVDFICIEAIMEHYNLV